MTTTAPLTSYGPLQFPDRAGLTLWQFTRAQRLGLIPGPDVAGDRWSAAVFDDAFARIDAIRQAVGAMPDVGAVRAEEHLAERFNTTVHPGTAAELARRGHLPVVGDHKGHPLYCGLTLENFTDRRKVARASTAGHLHMRDAAARILGLRASDFDHLVRAGLLTHADTARSGWNKHDVVLLYRQADLDRVARSHRIDWDAARPPRAAAHRSRHSPPRGSRRPDGDDGRARRGGRPGRPVRAPSTDTVTPIHRSSAMPETTIRPEPRTTALSLTRMTALDRVARHHHGREELPSPNWDMYNTLTAALEHWRAAGTLKEDALLLAEWLAVELSSYLFQQLGQDKARFDRWLLEFGDQVCQSQTNEHPAGPTAMEILSVIADDLVPSPGGPTTTERLIRIGLPYLHYVRQDHDVEDAREIALTFALWAGAQLAALMHHDIARVNAYLDARTH